MPVVRISDAAFAELRTLATWLKTKTPAETLELLVKMQMQEFGLERDAIQPDTPIPSSGYFAKTPGLSFTEPLRAKIGRFSLDAPTWSEVLFTTIKIIKNQGYTGSRLAELLKIRVRVGRYEGQGYKFYPEFDLSIQGLSAPDCWREIERLAQDWKIPVALEFRWKRVPKAERPGQIGTLTVDPK